jgi:hypothetical protein
MTNAPERRDRRREQHEVGPHVGDDLRVQGGDRPVAVGADADRGDLVAAVVGGEHVLRARLDPLHRAVELARERRERDLLAVDLQLAAEAAADVGRDARMRSSLMPRMSARKSLQEVGDLGGRVDRQVGPAEVRDDAARLDRARRRAVVDDPPLDDDVASTARPARPRRARARATTRGRGSSRTLVDERRAVLERRLDVGDDRQRVVLDEDVLAASIDRVAVLADDDGDGSPTCLTSSLASGQCSGALTSTPGGTQAIGRPDSSSRSLPVMTACTPGRAFAASVSTETMRAWASGERMIAM